MTTEVLTEPEQLVLDPGSPAVLRAWAAGLLTRAHAMYFCHLTPNPAGLVSTECNGGSSALAWRRCRPAAVAVQLSLFDGLEAGR